MCHHYTTNNKCISPFPNCPVFYLNEVPKCLSIYEMLTGLYSEGHTRFVFHLKCQDGVNHSREQTLPEFTL